LTDLEVKVEYDTLESEYEIIRSLIKIRQEQNITQEQLAEAMNKRLLNLLHKKTITIGRKTIFLLIFMHII